MFTAIGELPVVAIGPYKLANSVLLAPMAGITDLPFRRLAWRLGAGLVYGEMTVARPDLCLLYTSPSPRD